MQDNQPDTNVQAHNEHALPSDLEVLKGENGVLKEDNISNVFTYLLNKANPSSHKVAIVNMITNAVQHNRMLSESFAFVNCCSVYIHLIDLFELEEGNAKLKEAIEKLITLLINNITLRKDVYERVFKYCRKTYNKPKPTKDNIDNCLTLVKLFYPTANGSRATPKNYFAFYDPANKGIVVEHKQYEMSNGINFILSFKLQSAHNDRSPQPAISLISLELTNRKLKPININIAPKETNAHLALDPDVFELSDSNAITFDYDIYYILTFVFHPVNNSLCVFVNDSQDCCEYFFRNPLLGVDKVILG